MLGSDRISGGTIRGGQADYVLSTEIHNGARERNLASHTLAKLPGDFTCNGLIDLKPHQAERLLSLALGQNVEKRRLFQLDRECLSKSVVEYRILRLVFEVSKDDGVLLAQLCRPPAPSQEETAQHEGCG